MDMQNLRIPGPVPCPLEVMESMSQPLINHRGPEFKELLYSVTDRLKQVFNTTNDLYILTSSGTGALEAALINTLSPGDKVLATVTGAFGKRFADMAEAVGCLVTRLEFEPGTVVDPKCMREALNEDPEIKAVMTVHNETSTGTTNDLESISAIAKGEFDKLLIVDAISSLGCIPLPVDRWGCDVVATASQKGFLVPPGLAFISFSSTAWAAWEKSTSRRYYFDLGSAQQFLEKGQTCFTPNIPAFFALDIALDMLLNSGLDKVYEWHQHIAELTRKNVTQLGLSLFPLERDSSNTVTAVKIPEGIDGVELIETLRTEHKVVLADGPGSLEGKIFRIGHMGAVTEKEIFEMFDALQIVLGEMGHQIAIK